MRRRLPRGLRPRLLLALLLTSAVTLGIAATVLLSPLPDRLRERAHELAGGRDGVAGELREGGRSCPRIRSPSSGRPRSCASAPTAGCSCSTPSAVGRPIYDTNTGAGRRGATLVALRTLRTLTTTTELQGDDVRIGVRLFGGKGVDGVLVVERRLTEVTTAIDQVRNALLAAGAVGLLVAVALAVALRARCCGGSGACATPPCGSARRASSTPRSSTTPAATRSATSRGRSGACRRSCAARRRRSTGAQYVVPFHLLDRCVLFTTSPSGLGSAAKALSIAEAICTSSL